MSRKRARETALKLLYEYSITGELLENSIKESPDTYKAENLDDKDWEYLKIIINEFPNKEEEIDTLISDNSHSWKIDRIAKVDLAIIRLALFEVLFLEMNVGVSVNEAVELAKKYSAEKSYKYVNGLLGGCLRSLDK